MVVHQGVLVLGESVEETPEEVSAQEALMMQVHEAQAMPT
jgi:hypothetical protein